LSHGTNEISAKVKNQDGAASLLKKMTIEYTKPNFKQQLHFIGIGVSTYEQADKIDGFYNLKYAHRDVEEMATFLEQNITGNRAIKSTLLLNEQATKANILNLKKQLSTVSVDDIVLVYFAGHGRMNGANNWCFTPHDYTEAEGQQTGITEHILQELMDSSPSRKKVIMIDACNAGEALTRTTTALEPSYQPSTTKSDSLKNDRGVVQVGTTKTTIDIEQLKEMFNDLRNETGTIIIAASGANEAAIEGLGIKNGVFTHALLNAFGTIMADSNFDQKLTVSELMTYTFDEVSTLTNKRQKPNFRRKNAGLDFILWERKRAKVDYETLFEDN